MYSFAVVLLASAVEYSWQFEGLRYPGSAVFLEASRYALTSQTWLNAYRQQIVLGCCVDSRFAGSTGAGLGRDLHSLDIALCESSEVLYMMG